MKTLKVETIDSHLVFSRDDLFRLRVRFFFSIYKSHLPDARSEVRKGSFPPNEAVMQTNYEKLPAFTSIHSMNLSLVLIRDEILKDPWDADILSRSKELTNVPLGMPIFAYTFHNHAYENLQVRKIL